MSGQTLDDAISQAQAQYAELQAAAKANQEARRELKLKLTGWLKLQEATKQLRPEDGIKLKLIDGVVVQEV